MTTADNIECLYSASYRGDIRRAREHASSECLSLETSYLDDLPDCTLYTFADTSSILISPGRIEVWA